MKLLRFNEIVGEVSSIVPQVPLPVISAARACYYAVVTRPLHKCTWFEGLMSGVVIHEFV